MWSAIVSYQITIILSKIGFKLGYNGIGYNVVYTYFIDTEFWI